MPPETQAIVDGLKSAILPEIESKIKTGIEEAQNGIVEKVQNELKRSSLPAFIATETKIEVEPGVKFGRMIKTIAQSEMAKKSYLDQLELNYKAKPNSVDAYLIESAKNLSVGDFTGGGALVPEEFSTEIIPMLDKESVVRSSGARILPMPNGNMRKAKQTGGTTLYWLGETDKTTKSDMTFGHINLAAKKANVTIVLSNDLIRQNSFNIDSIVRDEIIKRIALGEDLAFIRGTGTSNEPKGLFNQIASGNKFNSGGKTEALILADVFTAMGNLEDNNVIMNNPVWLMSKRSKRGLMALVDASNIRSQLGVTAEQGFLMGYPIKDTNQISNAVTSTYSEIYFVDMGYFIIGDTMNLNLQVVPYGSYWNGSTYVSGLTTDETVITGWIEVDCALEHDIAGTVIKNVAWGT